MKLIICVDLDNGMLFNGRRQSKDRNLITYIYKMIGNKSLWLTEFSKDLFEEGKYNLFEVEKIETIKDDDYVFLENIEPKIFENKFDEIILFNWNRKYPADLYFNISLENWTLICEEEFEGFSHDKITKKIYMRGGVYNGENS